MDGREAEELAEKFFKEIEEHVEDIDDEDEIREYAKMILNLLLSKCDEAFDVMKAQREAQAAAAEAVEETYVPFFWEIKEFGERGMFERKR